MAVLARNVIALHSRLLLSMSKYKRERERETSVKVRMDRNHRQFIWELLPVVYCEKQHGTPETAERPMFVLILVDNT